MFGYVKISDTVSDSDYEIYKSYYCGLCRALRHCSAPISCMTLSYEAVFLFILLSAVSDDDIPTSYRKCLFHPFFGINTVENNYISSYCAHINIIMAYLKIQDDLSDSRKNKTVIAELIFRRIYKRSSSLYPDISDIICRCIDKLHKLENEKCNNAELCADCFAEMLKAVFCPSFISDPDTRRILGSIGYDLGRWIYIIDAIDDIEEDFKYSMYNPFLEAENVKNIKDIKEFKNKIFLSEERMLTYTLYRLSAAFELPDIKRNKSVLENIIYSGLPDMQKYVGTGRKYSKSGKIMKEKNK
ncbi:MAG: hypothetical protein J1F64_05705 [Oscillospiraceae bacterium]|nr:hypothetical protein [Oscillospiraceae bacterium]